MAAGPPQRAAADDAPAPASSNSDSDTAYQVSLVSRSQAAEQAPSAAQGLEQLQHRRFQQRIPACWSNRVHSGSRKRKAAGGAGGRNASMPTAMVIPEATAHTHGCLGDLSAVTTRPVYFIAKQSPAIANQGQASTDPAPVLESVAHL